MLFNKHKDLPFLPEKMKTKLNSAERLVCNINNKKDYVVHVGDLKQALNHGLTLKEIFFKEKYFFKSINNTVFGKTIEDVRKHRDIKLVTTNKRRNQLISEPNYHTT